MSYEGPVTEVRRKALDFLSRREHGKRELAGKLRVKGYSDDAVATVMEELSREGLVSDARFTENFVHNRVERGHGPIRVFRELRERGVEESVIRTQLERYETEWSERVVRVRCKRFGKGKPQDYRERARQGRFLEYRGFTGEQIRHALGDEGY